MAETSKTETQTWYETRPWFDEPRPIEVARETRWTIVLPSGKTIQKGYCDARYHASRTNAVETLRAIRSGELRAARAAVAIAKAALDDFNARFPVEPN